MATKKSKATGLARSSTNGAITPASAAPVERINLPSGRWFDAAKAEQFDEHREFDGRNFISRATGSQWEHERLYRTAKGVWVVHSWSQWQGTLPRYAVISDDEACAWLLAQGHFEQVERLFAGHVEAAEL